VNRRRRMAAAATGTGTAAALVAGYAAAGATGLIDVAAVATLGVLIAARGTLRGQTPRPVRPQKQRQDPAWRSADFPAYARIASDLEWAQMSRRHYEHALRPRLDRLATALSKPVDLTVLGDPGDSDGPGIDLATLDRIITQLEGP
jgi:hypothetical protein